MNATTTYERLIAAVGNLAEDDRNTIRFCIAHNIRELSPLAALALDLRAEVQKEAAKNLGASQRLAAFKRMVKDGAKNDRRDFAQAPRMQDGFQVYTNGTALVKLAEPLPIDCAEYDFDVLDLLRRNTSRECVPLTLPDVGELKAIAAEWKATHAKSTPPVYKFPGVELYVNPLFLADLITVTGAAAAAYDPAKTARDGLRVGMVQLDGAHGSGILCPIFAASSAREWWHEREAAAKNAPAAS